MSVLTEYVTLTHWPGYCGQHSIVCRDSHWTFTILQTHLTLINITYFQNYLTREGAIILPYAQWGDPESGPLPNEGTQKWVPCPMRGPRNGSPEPWGNPQFGPLPNEGTQNWIPSPMREPRNGSLGPRGEPELGPLPKRGVRTGSPAQWCDSIGPEEMPILVLGRCKRPPNKNGINLRLIDFDNHPILKSIYGCCYCCRCYFWVFLV